MFPNRTLHDTLQAIEGFLGKYDYRMFPQDSHCTLDYPLCLPIAADLQGVRRIHAYLQHLCLENAFLLRFPPDAQAHVYHALSPDPRDLLISLYECAADQALGCMLCGGDLQSLTLGANGHAVLVQRLAPLTLPDLRACLQPLRRMQPDRLHMTAPAERQYLQGAASRCPRACTPRWASAAFDTYFHKSFICIYHRHFGHSLFAVPPL